MRTSTRHVARNIGVVVAVGVILAGAWVAQSGGFAVAIAIALIGFVAMLVPVAVIVHEERDLPSNTRRTHP